MRNREQAARAAEATVFNKPGYCQLHTRLWFDAPSVGDLDGDGAADAEDGWKSEPLDARHTADRNPPRGVPVSYLGGSSDNGHRAISVGDGMIRSTDAGGNGRMATVPLNWPEVHWGLKYVGWSSTMDGYEIPIPPNQQTRGDKVDEALDALEIAEERARDGGERDTLIKRAMATLKRIPFIKKK